MKTLKNCCSGAAALTSILLVSGCGLGLDSLVGGGAAEIVKPMAEYQKQAKEEIKADNAEKELELLAAEIEADVD